MAFSLWPPARSGLVGSEKRSESSLVGSVLRDFKQALPDNQRLGTDLTVMASNKEKRAITRVLRDTIKSFCHSTNLFGGRVVVDGIICITGQSESQELVVKVHEKLGFDEISNHTCHRNGTEEAEDLRPLKKRSRLEDYTGYDETVLVSSDLSTKKGQHNAEVADLSVSSRTILISPEDSRSTLSPSPAHYPGHSPDSPSAAKTLSNSFDRSIFSAVPPFFLQKRAPIKNERWSPNQPIPTIPECRQCSFTFDSFDILSDHNEAVHTVFTCQHCFKTFTSRSNLERHSRLHTGHKPYACTICGKSFSRKDHLSNHATKHAYKCGTCSKRFADKKLLVSHYLADHGAVLTNICDFCNKGFSSPESYEEHVKVHPQFFGRDADSPSMVCPGSNQPTPTASPSPSGTPVNMKKHNCKDCSFSTNDFLTLTKHVLVHTDPQRCFTCLVCSKMFEDPLRYSDHMLVHQSEINVFECVLCHQICSTLHSLRRHEANHISNSQPKEALMVCNICDDAFTSHGELECHMTQHHEDEDQDEQMDDDDYDDDDDAASSVPSSDLPSAENRRKQKFPKPLQVKPAAEATATPAVDEPEEYEVVEPESPDDLSANEKTDENLNKYTSKTINIYPTDADDEYSPIKMEPVRRLLFNKSNSGVKNPTETPEKEQASPSKSSSYVAATPTTSENGPSKVGVVDMPSGPFTCHVCENVFPVFQELEMHCFSEHNRSPCMFCPKTFAQKANRDRHVCLHTGERPYACPECDEKFSRGDKLKLHRIRVHKVHFPSFGGRQRDPSPALGADTAASEDWSKDGESWRGKTEVFNTWSADGPSESVYTSGELAIQVANQAPRS